MADKTISWFNHSCFSGLPRFYGGKRKIANFILAHSKGNIFIDAFFGAGSVSLLAKAENYQVIANDLSLHSYFLGIGFLENERIKIDEYDIKRLFIKAENNKHYCEKNYANKLFTTRHSRFIDNAATILNVNKQIHSIQKYALLNNFLIKFSLSLRPYGNLSTKFLVPFFEHPFDTPEGKVPLHSNVSYMRDAFIPNLDLAMRLIEPINKSVFSNGKKNKFHRLDVFEFIKKVDGDTIYLDPPYAGASDYENYYDVLDSILMQEKITSPKSVFNNNDWQDFISQLLELSQKIPRWIISFGCEATTPQDFLELIKKHRSKATLYEIPYVYSVGAVSKGHSKTLPKTIEIMVVADK